MSFPAELTLRTTEDGPRLFRNPCREIEVLHGSEHRWNDVALNPGEDVSAGAVGGLLDIRVDIELGGASEVGLIVQGQTIRYDVKGKTLSALGDAPLTVTDGHLQLSILVDRTSLETFANGGCVSLTSCYVPEADEGRLTLFAKGGSARVKSMVVYELKSAWR